MDQIELVRSKTDIVDLIGNYVSLKKAGRNFKALCPFHSEKTPSFIISPELQIFKCFGCDKAGNAFQFLMEYEGMEFGEALRFLADRAGIKLQRRDFSDKQQSKERLYEVNHLASEFYHYVLNKHSAGKQALEYLLKRGINPSSIKLFRLGFAPDQWESLVDFLLKKKNYQVEDLEAAGLAIKGKRGHYDRFRGRVMFPLWDHRGQIVGFAGRVLEKKDKEGKYINTPETLIYHKSNMLYGFYHSRSFLKKTRKAIVVEGELDMISSWQAGVKNVVAIKGSAFTEMQVGLLKRLVETVIVALDADAAGQDATLRSISLAEAQGLDVRVVEIIGGKDPDEIAQQNPAEWRRLVKQAVSIYDFYINLGLKRFGVKTGEAKKKLSQLVVPVLAKIDNEVMKAHYFKKLAAVLGVSEEIVIKELAKVKLGRTQVRSKTQLTTPTKTRREHLEDYILSLVLKTGEAVKDWLIDFDLSLISQRGVVKVLTLTKKLMQNKKKLVISQLIDQLSEELKPLAQEAFLQDEDLPNDCLKELLKASKELASLALKQKLQELELKITQAEKQKQINKAKSLQEEFANLSKQLREYLV